MNSISAVLVTDIYKRHFVASREEAHYVRAAKTTTLFSSGIMIGGAWLLFQAPTQTLQHLWTEFQSILAGGLLGLFMLGFLTKRGSGRAVGPGIACAVLFSAWISAAELGWLPGIRQGTWKLPFDTYYTGLIGNILTFGIGYTIARIWPKQPVPGCQPAALNVPVGKQ